MLEPTTAHYCVLNHNNVLWLHISYYISSCSGEYHCSFETYHPSTATR